MYYLFIFSKITKYIALTSVVISCFTDLIIFKLLCLLILIDLILNFSELKCSILQLIGMMQVQAKFGKNLPSVHDYENKTAYSLPFYGKWTVVNGCFTEEYSHSWGIPTQRYAYDFIILDDNGASCDGEPTQCAQYFCYGKEILAPADGVVAEVLNNAKDSLIFSKGKFWSRAKHIAGNYIIIQHAEQEFSLLAHLQKDSMTVKAGDAVKKGQCIAKCGNTGNSSEPHLHFQLQTGQNFYNSAGLPVKFKDIRLSSVEHYSNYDSRGHMSAEKISDGYITRGFMAENEC